MARLDRLKLTTTRLKPVVSGDAKPKRRLKLKDHAAEAGGVSDRVARARRLKLKDHAAEAGGVWGREAET